MKRSLLTGAALSACALVLSCSLARAQQVVAQLICMPRAQVEERVAREIGPHVRHVGITQNETGLVELLIGSDGRFGVILTTQEAGACFMVMGDNLEENDPIPTGEPA